MIYNTHTHTHARMHAHTLIAQKTHFVCSCYFKLIRRKFINMCQYLIHQFFLKQKLDKILSLLLYGDFLFFLV